MPNRQRHRGPHPDDEHRFASSQVGRLRSAVHDYCWLLSRGYAENGALKLVGDRFRLDKRQRQAVQRGSCSDEAAQRRAATRCGRESLAGNHLQIDGFNLLITLESALAEGFLFLGRDGCLRDLASIHGSYRRVVETGAAIRLAADGLGRLGVESAEWLLDSPVSNSGRLKGILELFAAEHHLSWDVRLDRNPDAVLIESDWIVVSTDSLILDNARRWIDLGRFTIESSVAEANIIRLSIDGATERE